MASLPPSSRVRAWPTIRSRRPRARRWRGTRARESRGNLVPEAAPGIRAVRTLSRTAGGIEIGDRAPDRVWTARCRNSPWLRRGKDRDDGQNPSRNPESDEIAACRGMSASGRQIPRDSRSRATTADDDLSRWHVGSFTDLPGRSGSRLDAQHANQQQSIRRRVLDPAPRFQLKRVVVLRNVKSDRHPCQLNGGVHRSDRASVRDRRVGFGAPAFASAVVVAGPTAILMTAPVRVTGWRATFRLVASCDCFCVERPARFRIAGTGAWNKRAATQHLPNDQQRSQEGSHHEVAPERALSRHHRPVSAARARRRQWL